MASLDARRTRGAARRADMRAGPEPGSQVKRGKGGMSTSGMMQRCWEHDYCAPCFYMITVVTEPRRDCLGVWQAQAGGAATVVRSPMGEVVQTGHHP